jgi:hypothetical protein
MVAASSTRYDVVTFLTHWGTSTSNFVAISSLVVKLLKTCRVQKQVGHTVFKTTAMCNVMDCSLVDSYQHFGETQYLHLLGSRISKTKWWSLFGFKHCVLILCSSVPLKHSNIQPLHGAETQKNIWLTTAINIQKLSPKYWLLPTYLPVKLQYVVLPKTIKPPLWELKYQSYSTVKTNTHTTHVRVLRRG